jgi:ketosteroid isomerase-like protein
MTDLVAAVRRSIEAWNRDDFDGCVAMAHPCIEWSSGVAQQLSGKGAVYRGLSGLRRYWDEWHELWRVRLKIMEIVRADDTVVVVACTEARGDSSGVTLRQPIGYVYEFEDGMARAAQSFIDPDDAYEAAGIERGRAPEPELYSAVSQGR